MEKQTAKRPAYFVRAVTSGGRVLGYGVYDRVHGMESEHARFSLSDYSPETALQLANSMRDDLSTEAA